MALKVVTFVCLLVLSMAAVVKVAEAQAISLNRVEGTIFCTPNANIGVNGVSTPVFANALVRLTCSGTVIASATTNAAGLFSILRLYPSNLIVPTCRVVLVTPLSTCNSTLSSVGGVLTAPLKYVGRILGVFYFVTLNFA